MNSRLKKGAAITALVVSVVGGFEGIRTVAYRDPVGIPTVCYGETRGVHMGDKYTVKQCDAMLARRLLDFEKGVTACLTHPEKVPDKTFAAFIAFSYNVGIGAFCASTLAQKANAGDLRGACNELPKWNRAGGRVLPGLTKRRLAEKKLCLAGLAA